MRSCFKNTHRRNARERVRIQRLNDMLNKLQNKLPMEWRCKKMSKIDILRKAIYYIRLLYSQVHGTETPYRTLHPQCGQQVQDEEETSSDSSDIETESDQE